MTNKSYWTRTALHAAMGGAIGAVLGIGAALVFAFTELPKLSFHSGTVPAEFSIPLFFIGLGTEGAILGGVVGVLLGYLSPVAKGPPFLTSQFPLKFVLASAFFGALYLGIVRPRLTERRNQEDLLRALWRQDATAAGRLIAQGARVDAPMGDGTPLFAAAQQGKLEICRLLLSHGADVNRKNIQGETPLMVALEAAHPDVAQALVEAGAEVNFVDARGQTPLIMASPLDSPSIIETQLSKGAEVNHAVMHGYYSPLIAAVNARRAQNVELLLRAGADPNLAPQGAPSPLAQARRVGDQAIVDLLTAHGAN